MPQTGFEYDEGLLSSCANSKLASFVASGNPNGQEFQSSADGSDESCLLLHQQHALHFDRLPPGQFKKTSSQEDRFELDERLRRFVQAVLLVHSHNHKSNHRRLHRLTLNRFADEEQPLPLDETDNSSAPDLSFLDWDSIDKEWEFSELGDQNVSANLTFGKGGLGGWYHHKERIAHSQVRDSIGEKLKFPGRPSDPYFAVPVVDDPDLDGELVKVKPRHAMEKQVNSGEFEETDEFGKHLNWASGNNPDGVPIVNDAFDQGECGSCWAFAAAGSLEASVARRQAREAYNEFFERPSVRRREEKHIDILHDEAVEFAKSVEEAAFQNSNLSIQELIDCDTAADQGCIGGNPLLAFYFIHRYGLTSWDSYPYVGYEDVCHKKRVSHPVAKVQSWGIIAPNHEHHMQLVLRFIGPIAVGVNGADRSFLAYQDGIFDHPYCSQGANHALLITGYGQEVTYTGELVKYWIARNSWGTDWGENGYIRVKRGDGLKGTRGMCGIARSPSVALGGVMLANRHRLEPYHSPKSSQHDSNPLSTSPPAGICGRLGFESCHEIVEAFGDHKAVVLGLTGVFFSAFLAVWPLTFQCRRRRQRRRRRAQEKLRLDPPLPPASKPGETDPLLGNRNATRYGE